MKFIKLFAFTLLVLSGFRVHAQVPDSLISDWNKAGVDSAFVYPSTIFDVTNYGVLPNDGIDDSPATISLINTLSTTGAILYFPAGSYNFSSSINLVSNCFIKGAGSDSTIFDFNTGNTTSNCFNIVGNASSSLYPAISGFQKGSNKLLVLNADSLFNINDRVEIRQQNGTWDTNPAFWATFAVGHISTIDSINNDTIYLREAFRMNLDSSLSPEIRKLNCIENTGIECLKFIRSDSLASSINYGIYFFYAFNSRVRGVESYKSIGAHIWSEISAHVEITQNYFHEAYTYDGNSSHGYGVILATHSVLHKIENNIFRKLRHSMMVKQGASGNVFGYNYSIQPNRSEFPSNAGADICLHGHFPFANLFEGNICQNASIDQAYGPNGPGNVLFRNRIELYGLIFSSGTVQSSGQVIVGNDIPSTTPFQGNYILFGNNHFESANRVKGVVTPSGTNSLSDTSLYLNGIPSFWNSTFNFPSIGIPTTLLPSQIPSALRYSQGINLAICSDPDSTSTFISDVVAENNIGINDVSFSNTQININWFTKKNGSYTLSIFDVTGKLKIETNVFVTNNQIITNLKWNEKTGIYFVKISNSQEQFTKKFLYTDE